MLLLLRLLWLPLPLLLLLLPLLLPFHWLYLRELREEPLLHRLPNEGLELGPRW